MKDLVPVDANNNNKIDLHVIKNGITNGSSNGGLVVKKLVGYTQNNGASCNCKNSK